MEELKSAIREIPDWPKKGILFYDLTTLMKDSGSFRKALDALITPHMGVGVDVVVGIEARGFIFARRWPMPSAQASFRCASPANCLHRLIA